MTAITLMELEEDILAHVNTDYYRPQGASSHGDDRLRIVGTSEIGRASCRERVCLYV